MRARCFVGCADQVCSVAIGQTAWRSIRLGSLDGDPEITPQFHTFVEAGVAWGEIRDDLPQYPGPVPFELR
jgi:hypothetical protein